MLCDPPQGRVVVQGKRHVKVLSLVTTCERNVWLQYVTCEGKVWLQLVTCEGKVWLQQVTCEEKGVATEGDVWREGLATVEGVSRRTVRFNGHWPAEDSRHTQRCLVCRDMTRSRAATQRSCCTPQPEATRQGDWRGLEVTSTDFYYQCFCRKNTKKNPNPTVWSIVPPRQ